jgi:hypothetical protein
MPPSRLRATDAHLMLTARSLPARHTDGESGGEDSIMSAREFVTLHQACGKSLERLQRESQQTLALLLLAAQSRLDASRQDALRLQRDKEDRARLEYQRHRRELFGLFAQD